MSVSGSVPQSDELLDKSHFFNRCEEEKTAIVELREDGKGGEVVLFGGRTQLGSGQANNHGNVKKLV
jgi:hypothetical protein